MKRASQIMTEHPSTCTPEGTVYEAVKIMEMNDCGAVPLVDEEGHCVGIVTDRDICLFLGLGDKATQPKEIPLRLVMSDNPITCHPDDALETIVQLMEEHQVRRIPVVDQRKKLVGIIAQADIALEDESPEEVAELLEEISKEHVLS